MKSNILFPNASIFGEIFEWGIFNYEKFRSKITQKIFIRKPQVENAQKIHKQMLNYENWGCKKKILQLIADRLSYGLCMSTFLPRRSGFHHGGRFSRLHSVISRSNQHVYSTHYTSSCTPHVSIISREQVMSFGYDQIEQILN